MHEILLDNSPNCNTEAEPEMLIIHSPRHQQHSAWNDWAKGAAKFLEDHGWRINRIGPEVHAIHPSMLQVH